MTEFETRLLGTLERLVELLEARQGAETSLLCAIHNTCGDAAFNSVELMRHAVLPQNAELRMALEREFGTPNTRKVGKRLAVLQGRNVDGFIVQSLGTDNGGHIWSVRVCPASQAKLTSAIAHPGHGVMLDAFDERSQKCG